MRLLSWPLPSEAAGLKGRAEAANLVGIYAALADREIADVLRDFGGAMFSNFKGVLTEVAVDKLGPIGEEMQRLVADPTYIDGVLAGGSARARAITAPVLSEVYETIGFIES